MASHEVTGPLAVVKDVNGKLRYYYTGAVLPEDVPAAEVARLTAIGLVSPVDAEKPVTRKPAAAKD